MIETRITSDARDAIAVLTTLFQHADEVPAVANLLPHAERVVHDATYQFLIANDGDTASIEAAGIVTFFHQPMAETHVLAVEALWCRDDDRGVQDAIWRMLVQR